MSPTQEQERQMRQIGQRIRELRLEQGLSQEALTHMIEPRISLRTLVRAEQGEAKKMETLGLIASALGVTVWELLPKAAPRKKAGARKRAAKSSYPQTRPDVDLPVTISSH